MSLKAPEYKKKIWNTVKNETDVQPDCSLILLFCPGISLLKLQVKATLNFVIRGICFIILSQKSIESAFG